MQPIRHILFPVDFSDHCRAVAPAVAALARRAGARVSLVHALDLPTGGYADWQAFVNLVDVESFRQDAANHLERFLAETLGGIEVRRALVEGRAAGAIVEYAAAEQADLVMMPSRGLSGFRALLLGSVTERVLHDARCPVWTEAHAETQQPSPEFYRSVVCALDLSPEAASVKSWAAGFASLWDAPLHEVRVAPDAIDTLVDAIAESVERHQADLLVIGRGHLRSTFGALRTHSLDIVRQSRCPVVCV